MATGKPIGEPLKGHDDAVLGAAFSPDDKRIVTASEDKTAHVWDVFPDTQALISTAKAAAPRCLILAQRKGFFLLPEPPTWCIEMAKWPSDTPIWKQCSPIRAPARTRRCPKHRDFENAVDAASRLRPKGIDLGIRAVVSWIGEELPTMPLHDPIPSTLSPT